MYEKENMCINARIERICTGNCERCKNFVTIEEGRVRVRVCPEIDEERTFTKKRRRRPMCR